MSNSSNSGISIDWECAERLLQYCTAVVASDNNNDTNNINNVLLLIQLYHSCGHYLWQLRIVMATVAVVFTAVADVFAIGSYYHDRWWWVVAFEWIVAFCWQLWQLW